MPQLPFSILCGTPSPTSPALPNCPPDGSYVVSDDGTLWSVTQGFTPCAPPAVTTGTVPGRVEHNGGIQTGVTWNPHNVSPYPFNDAPIDASCPLTNYPLPPHCWGWEGGSDYLRQTSYSFVGTLLQVADTSTEFGQFDTRYLSVQVDYDVRIQRRFTERVIVYHDVAGGGGFRHYDISDPSTIDSDTCTDLSSSDVTTHHTDYSSGGTVNVTLGSTGAWNSIGLTGGWSFSEWQDSDYDDTSLPDVGVAPGNWGRFWTFQTAREVPGHLYAHYRFGRETRTVSNVRFTLTCAWRQFHCVGSGGGSPCNCNGDCPPCSGSGSVHSGKCATLCASGGISPTPVNGWSIKNQAGTVIASDDTPNGWGVSRATACSLTVCAPCLTPEKLAAGGYQGPYTITWGTPDTCLCGGVTEYKIFQASFSLVADVICPTNPPPQDSGRSLSYDVSDARRHARAYVANDTDGMAGSVVIGLASDVFPLDWQKFDTKMTANRISLRWDRQNAGGMLYALIEITGSIVLLRSPDEGHTWVNIATVGSGTHPALLMARDGRRFCFFMAGGLVVCKIYDGAGNVWREALDIGIGGGAQDTMCAEEFTGTDGEWNLALFYKSGGIQFAYTQDLAHWTKVSVGSGSHPGGIVARDGRRLCYWVSGSLIQGKILDAAGHTLKEIFTAIPYSVDDDEIAVDETVEQSGDWYISILYRSGGKVTTKSSKDGIVFA